MNFYVNGVIPSIGKRISKYAFGDSLFKFEADHEKQEFRVYVLDDVEEEAIAYFMSHWVGFKVIKVPKNSLRPVE